MNELLKSDINRLVGEIGEFDMKIEEDNEFPSDYDIEELNGHGGDAYRRVDCEERKNRMSEFMEYIGGDKCLKNISVFGSFFSDEDIKNIFEIMGDRLCGLSVTSGVFTTGMVQDYILEYLESNYSLINLNLNDVSGVNDDIEKSDRIKWLIARNNVFNKNKYERVIDILYGKVVGMDDEELINIYYREIDCTIVGRKEKKRKKRGGWF